jgi:hypothetical protein
MSIGLDCNCPCSDETLKYLTSKPIDELSAQDLKYIHEKDQECANYLLPNYNKESRWIKINDMIFELCYYDKETIEYKDSILICWIKDDDGGGTYPSLTQYLFNFKNRSYKWLAAIHLFENNVWTRMYFNEKETLVPENDCFIKSLYQNMCFIVNK